MSYAQNPLIKSFINYYLIHLLLSRSLCEGRRSHGKTLERQHVYLLDIFHDSIIRFILIPVMIISVLFLYYSLIMDYNNNKGIPCVLI